MILAMTEVLGDLIDEEMSRLFEMHVMVSTTLEGI